MFETSKAVMRRLHDSRFATRYFVGDGIDIGAGADGLGAHQAMFPAMRSSDADLQELRVQLQERKEELEHDFGLAPVRGNNTAEAEGERSATGTTPAEPAPNGATRWATSPATRSESSNPLSAHTRKARGLWSSPN